MGRGIKAGKSKGVKPNKNFMLMEESYREGYKSGLSNGMEKGYCQGKDDYLGLSNLLFQVATANDFGWDQTEFAILKESIDKITSDANERGIDVVELSEELKSLIENKEDEIMAKKKYTDGDLVKGIEKGLSDDEILEQLNVPMGSSTRIKKRLTNLRKTHGALEVNTKEPTEFPEADFELKLYDTLTRWGKWYRVTKIGEHNFEVMNTQGKKQPETVLKADYISGKSGFIKRDMPEVKSYIDESLKKKPAVPNPEFEAAVKDMVTVKNIPEENTVDDFTPAIDEDIDPAYMFDQVPEKSGTVKIPCETFTTTFKKQAELAFKHDMGIYTDKVSKITEKLNNGKIIDLADISEYNNIAEKYRGVYGYETTKSTMSTL